MDKKENKTKLAPNVLNFDDWKNKVRKYNASIKPTKGTLNKKKYLENQDKTEEKHYETPLEKDVRDDFKQTSKMRKEYADKIFKFVCVWLGFMLSFVFLQGISANTNIFYISYNLFSFKFHLSDPLLITLVTTTTTSVLGLFLGVVYFLFPKSNNK